MSFGKGASCASGTSAALPARNGLDQAKLAGLLSVGAEVTAARALRSAGSSGLEGGAAASTRAALYPGEEASRRRPVTPGPAGPYGLQPRHSLAPPCSVRFRDRPAADRRDRTSQRPKQRPPPPPARQQQASDGSNPTPLNGPLQPQGLDYEKPYWKSLPPLSLTFHFYWLCRLSVSPLLTNPPPLLVFIG